MGADLAPGAPDGLAARCTALKACEGEAVVNNRKNKVIAAYELAVTLGWEGAAEAGGEAVTGARAGPWAGRGGAAVGSAGSDLRCTRSPC